MSIRHVVGRRAAAVAVLLLAVAAGACSATVDGSGHPVSTSSARNGFPTPSAPSTNVPATAPTGASSSPGPTNSASSSTSSGAPVGNFTCPTITYPHAHLSFDCVVDGLTLSTSSPIWPVSMQKTVEPKTGWLLEEGAADWGDPGSAATKAIALELRTQMVARGGYGTAPTVHTDHSDDATVAGVAAHVLQSTITLNPEWARGERTKVTTEQLWIVAMTVSAHDVAIWYTSIPSLESQLWAKVPTIIRTIRIS
jgi:hypothetical protein